tara:strand:- start:728 stop:1282 length:555 start_codon:yes stop_codon:yes gene_type:complete
MSKRFRRTPEEIKEGLTVEQAKAKRKESKDVKKWEDIAKNSNGHEPKTQEDLTTKHKENPTIKVSAGVGDVVEKVTKATGIKKLVDWFTPDGEDCGCDERKEKWNAKTSILRHKVNVECLTLAEYNYMKPLLSTNQPISAKHVNKLAEIYERIFNVKLHGDCKGCSFAKKLDELKAVLNTYDDE